MKFDQQWSRRRFIATSGAAAAQAAATLKGLGQSPENSAAAQQKHTQEAARAMPAAGVITGGIQPLMKNMTARPLRYKPVNGEFVIRNGTEFFNRPIYGPNNAFRVDAGDKPEFSLYLPGHGGNLKLGFIAADGRGSKWSANADEVVARYRPGRMIYEIRDALLGKGMLHAELLTIGTGSGLMLKMEGHALAEGTRFAWAFGGVSGRKGRRGGDIGCEVEPVSQFFQVRAEECVGNQIIVRSTGDVSFARVVAKAAEIVVVLPESSRTKVTPADFKEWNTPPDPNRHWDGTESETPILTGSSTIADEPLYLSLYRQAEGDPEPGSDVAAAFATRSTQVDAIASTLRADTPDEYINAAASSLGIAADAIWDARQGCVMHGAVAWRTPLAGWRGPYCLDALGNHDRAKTNFRHWIAHQNTTPVTTGDPAIGPWDPHVHLTRKEHLLHSNGDISNNHYDMNLVFFDALLRHLMWTGDMEFAREVWPALQRHLAWEHRLFRRTYTSTSGNALPLYEAYAAIWASDNLQYNGGGTAHSSAYNLFSLRAAAKLAHALGENAIPYESEAAVLNRGMQQLLWLPAQGAFAESKDLLDPQTAYTNPALWTVYHTIDSEVPTAKQARQMAAERLAKLKHIPIHGPGVPEDGCYMLSCSDWLPYMWSLNLLLLAENAHMALALWQTGMREEAYRIFKGSLLDSMYMGLCPGDFHMTSALDVHRQEAQRDFGDPIGIASRAFIEGLFGVQPDLLSNTIQIRPGFPSDWNQASLKHRDFDLIWHREGLKETLEFSGRFPKAAALRIETPARTTSLPAAHCNGKRVQCAFIQGAVGSPMLQIDVPAMTSCSLTLQWHGHPPTALPALRTYRVGDVFELPHGIQMSQIEDPQNCLGDGRISASGFHTVFATIREGDCQWSLPISFEAKSGTSAFPPVPRLAAAAMGEQVDLSLVLKDRITEIFTRGYIEPRSQYCSLAIPDTLLGGWANPDGRARIDDSGLRSCGGLLRTGIGVDFATACGSEPNCLFLSHWEQDQSKLSVALKGRARGIHLLMTGTTFPQCSRMQHGAVTIFYTDGSTATLSLRNPETWWPIEQDYLLDDYMFVNEAPLPPRVDLRSAQTRILEPAEFHGKGRTVPGGAATILHLGIDPAKDLASMQVQVDLYGVVIALMAATLEPI